MENSSPNFFPHYWIFQFNPDIYDWFTWMKENNNREQWLVTRFAKLISIGDNVAIWASGKNSGFYALAETTSYPLKNPLNPEQAKYYRLKDDAEKFNLKLSVYVKYLKVFADSPLVKDKCKEDGVLSSLEVLRDFTNATNFKMNKSQWVKILKTVNDSHSADLEKTIYFNL